MCPLLCTLDYIIYLLYIYAELIIELLIRPLLNIFFPSIMSIINKNKIEFYSNGPNF